MDILHKIGLYAPVLLGGAGYTVGIAVVTFAFAFVVGLLLGLVAFQFGLKSSGRRSWPQRISYTATSVYVRVLKGLPALTLLFCIYFSLPQFGIKINSFTTAVIGLGLIGAAMLTEVFRSALESLHPGQREAALASGMTPWAALVYVLLPQIWRVTLPSLANYAIALLKDTAVVAAVAAPEIMFYARNLVTRTFDAGLVYAMVALLYFALSFPLARLADRLERAAGHGRR